MISSRSEGVAPRSDTTSANKIRIRSVFTERELGCSPRRSASSLEDSPRSENLHATSPRRNRESPHFPEDFCQKIRKSRKSAAENRSFPRGSRRDLKPPIQLTTDYSDITDSEPAPILNPNSGGFPAW